jgi:hypothetical protein
MRTDTRSLRPRRDLAKRRRWSEQELIEHLAKDEIPPELAEYTAFIFNLFEEDELSDVEVAEVLRLIPQIRARKAGLGRA